MKMVQFFSLSLDVTVESSEKKYGTSVQFLTLSLDITVKSSEKKCEKGAVLSVARCHCGEQ